MFNNILDYKTNISLHSENLSEYNSDSIYNFLKQANISALRKINSNTYSGATLEELTNDIFVKIRDLGIETIVDLRQNSDKSYVNKCNLANIKYFKFPLDFIFNPGKSDIFIGKNRSQVNNFFIQNLKEFLNLTKNGKLFMGCQHGLDRTNFAIIMNYLFNFESNDKPPQILASDLGKGRTLLNKDLNLIRKINSAFIKYFSKIIF